MKNKLLTSIVIIFSLTYCGIPHDPSNTLEKIRNDTIKAGIVDNPPWAIWNNGTASGVEVEILKGIAGELNSEIKWKAGSEEELFAALETGSLDIVVSGLLKSSPYTALVGPTNPYVKTNLIIGIPPNINYSKAKIKKMVIGIPFGSARKSLLENKGYKIKEAADLKSYSGPVCAYEYEMDSLNKIPVGKALKIEKHILPVMKGENGWLVYIENYSRKNQNKIKEYLQNYGGRK